MILMLKSYTNSVAFKFSANALDRFKSIRYFKPNFSTGLINHKDNCVYLNHLSQSQRIALFFKTISRLGDGPFWYVMLLSIWAMCQ